jgi:hypothetical protein
MKLLKKYLISILGQNKLRECGLRERAAFGFHRLPSALKEGVSGSKEQGIRMWRFREPDALVPKMSESTRKTE